MSFMAGYRPAAPKEAASLCALVGRAAQIVPNGLSARRSFPLLFRREEAGSFVPPEKASRGRVFAGNTLASPFREIGRSARGHDSKGVFLLILVRDGPPSCHSCELTRE